jgi:phage head maturation protease
LDGHAALIRIPHESFDAFGTDFARHAFADSFARSLPELKREHKQHIGECTRAQSLPAYNEIVGEFDRTPAAERAYNDIARGALKGWSFHFYNGKHVPHPVHRGGVRYLRADVDEVSAVARPAVPGTVTAGLRSEPDALTRYLEIRAHVGLPAIGTKSGHRSLLVLDPLEYIEAVQARASAKLDDLVEFDYVVHEEMRDGLRPKTPQFQLGQLFYRNDTRGRHRR